MWEKFMDDHPKFFGTLLGIAMLFGSFTVIAILIGVLFAMFNFFPSCKSGNQSSVPKYAPIEVTQDEWAKPREGKIVQGPYIMTGGIRVVGVLTKLENGDTIVTTALISPYGGSLDGNIFYQNSKMMQQLTFKLKPYNIRSGNGVISVWIIDH